MERIALMRLAGIFLRIANLTFGGGVPTIVLLQREFAHRRRWLSDEECGLVFALARITPGTNVVAFCAGAAWRLSGWSGAIAAVIASTAPSAVLVVWLTEAYEVARAYPLALGATQGVMGAVVGMMAAGGWILIRPHLTGRTWIRTLVILVVSMALFWKFSLAPITLLALAAVIGFLWREPEGA